MADKKLTSYINGLIDKLTAGQKPETILALNQALKDQPGFPIVAGGLDDASQAATLIATAIETKYATNPDKIATFLADIQAPAQKLADTNPFKKTKGLEVDCIAKAWDAYMKAMYQGAVVPTDRGVTITLTPIAQPIFGNNNSLNTLVARRLQPVNGGYSVTITPAGGDGAEKTIMLTAQQAGTGAAVPVAALTLSGGVGISVTGNGNAELAPFATTVADVAMNAQDPLKSLKGKPFQVEPTKIFTDQKGIFSLAGLNVAFDPTAAAALQQLPKAVGTCFVAK